jgi:hypothetical protein
MAKASSSRESAPRTFRVRGASVFVVLGAVLGCADVLGIPPDPEVVPSPSQALSTPLDTSTEPLPSASGPSVPPEEPGTSTLDRPNSDGAIAPGNVAGIGETTAPVADGRGAAPTSRRDAGLADAAGDVSPDVSPEVSPEPPPADTCDQFERVPVDIVFIVDNSGSMAAADAEFEQALPAFATRLDRDQVDYRIILLSRHRRDERGASSLADTSICVAAPLSGLAGCPSERPALGPRFFPYSLKIDVSDSFQQTLTAFSTPDPFGLTERGWSEWLRTGALPILIEISDGDSALSSRVFVSGLAAAAPERFSADPDSAGFVFHSIVGVVQKFLALDLYLADEPIVSDVCTGRGSNPDNAGQVYQELSRSTRGLRQSICPANVMGLRLQVLATDVIRRSVSPCP